MRRPLVPPGLGTTSPNPIPGPIPGLSLTLTLTLTLALTLALTLTLTSWLLAFSRRDARALLGMLVVDVGVPEEVGIGL